MTATRHLSHQCGSDHHDQCSGRLVTDPLTPCECECHGFIGWERGERISIIGVAADLDVAFDEWGTVLRTIIKAHDMSRWVHVLLDNGRLVELCEERGDRFARHYQQHVPVSVMQILEDLASFDPIITNVTFGHGSYGSQCVLCGETDYLGRLVHRETCLWRRVAGDGEWRPR